MAYFAPILYALFVWWFSTGLVMYVVGRDRRTHVNSMMVMSALTIGAFYALWVTSNDTSVAGAYMAFTAALVVWGWHEMSFLTGLITGSRTTPCPGRPNEPTNMRAPLLPAIQSVIFHELAIAATAGLMFAMLWSGANHVGVWTFVILWLMRLSAKLNIYFGVQNLTEHFLPANLQYLKTYFCRRPMNAFFPFAVTASTIATVLLAAAAAHVAATPFEVTGMTFLATLLALAVLEHWFLVMPIPAERLWSWGLASRSEIPASDARDSERVVLATT